MVALKKYSKRQNGNTYNKKTDDANLTLTNNSNNDKHFYSNEHNDNKIHIKLDKRSNYNSFYVTQLTYAIYLVLVVVISHPVIQVQSAAVFLNSDFRSHPRFEPLCNSKQEHFIESDGKESSLILEFKASPTTNDRQKSCTRILSAPNGYGFIVRLILPKIRRGHHHATALTTATSSEENAGSGAKMKLTTLSDTTTSIIVKPNATALKSTMTRKCPMSIFSSLDPHTPQWRVDPCHLEDRAPEMEDPVRLFHGRVRIVWEHNNQHLHSKLMVTVLGKGEQCHDESKHQCLQIGDEPILCISKELECDGIRHCPVGNEYDSDEDNHMCVKRRRFSESLPPAMESEIFEHFAMEVFRNLFAFDATQMPEPNVYQTAQAPTTTSAPTMLAVAPALNATTLQKIDSSQSDGNNVNLFMNVENATEASNTNGKRNSTRSGLHSDLSKYGPWGYLMLGMLLCGGALLICGLWASASQNAVNNEREAAMQQGGTAGSSLDQTSNMSPPNYDELDPPPAYSVLFPNQKASNATLNSLAGAVGTPTTIATTPTINDHVPSSSQPRFTIEGGADEAVGSGNDSTI